MKKTYLVGLVASLLSFHSFADSNQYTLDVEMIQKTQGVSTILFSTGQTVIEGVPSMSSSTKSVEYIQAITTNSDNKLERKMGLINTGYSFSGLVLPNPEKPEEMKLTTHFNWQDLETLSTVCQEEKCIQLPTTRNFSIHETIPVATNDLIILKEWDSKENPDKSYLLKVKVQKL